METFRNVSQDDITKWRKNLPRGSRRVRIDKSDGRYASHAVDGVEGNTAYVSAPARPGVRREAREVVDAITERRLGSLMSAPKEVVQAYAAELKRQYPELTAHLSTEDVIKTVMRRAHEEATKVAFRKQLRRERAVV